MLYTIIITNTDGEHVNTNTINFNADSAQQAHEHAASIANGAARVRVYPTLTDDNGGMLDVGIMRGALMVARRTALNSVMRGGGKVTADIDGTQAAKAKAAAAAARIAANIHGGVINRLFTMLGELNSANARCNGATTAARIDGVINEYSQDTREFFAIAAAGLIDGIREHGADIVECYHTAYLTLNRYIASERAATERELSTEYIIDGGGDIVAFNDAIASIIRGGEKWTAADGGGMDKATAARLGDAIAAAAAALNPTQKRITILLGRGYSQAQIASITNRKPSTINANVSIIRECIAAAMRDGEFASMIDSARTAAAAANTREHAAKANKQRTANGAARKAASDKATQAARAKAYRERKKAAAAALAAAIKGE